MNTLLTRSKTKLPSIIESERLILRKPRIEDAETIFQTFSADEDVNRYMDKAPSTDLAETCRIIARFIRGWENNERFEYVIEDKASAKIVGIIGIRNPEDTDSLAYAISSQFIGKHYLTEAVNSLIKANIHYPINESEPTSRFKETLAVDKPKDKLAVRFERTLRHKIFNRNRGLTSKKHPNNTFEKAS